MSCYLALLICGSVNIEMESPGNENKFFVRYKNGAETELFVLRHFSTILRYQWPAYMVNDQVLREAGLRYVTCIRERHSKPEGFDHAEGPPAWFVFASGGDLSEGYGHDGPGVCLGDGHTEAESILAKWTRRRAAPTYVILPDLTT